MKKLILGAAFILSLTAAQVTYGQEQPVQAELTLCNTLESVEAFYNDIWIKKLSASASIVNSKGECEIMAAMFVPGRIHKKIDYEGLTFEFLEVETIAQLKSVSGLTVATAMPGTKFAIRYYKSQNQGSDA